MTTTTAAATVSFLTAHFSWISKQVNNQKFVDHYSTQIDITSPIWLDLIDADDDDSVTFGKAEIYFCTTEMAAKHLAQDARNLTEYSNTERELHSSDLASKEAHELLKSISRSLTLDRMDKYFNHHADHEQISSELEAICRAAELHPENVHPRFISWYAKNKHLKIKGQPLSSLSHAIHTTASTKLTDFRSIYHSGSLLTRLWETVTILERRLLVTEHGYIGMAPLRAKKGDMVCILFGCSVPVVLRLTDDDGSFTFIGECYLDGFTAGEALSNIQSKRRAVETFTLH
ncbi:hypothetical protein BT63DRAFT_449489 [Microthyrium microscopicum]|uniref:Heterokaryon incompatibility domain-containing protein n=1 Tax=Microthyrium microscopicum TaxID=703497 RepID=A0A6A6UTW6_9PEZI|nr:hypothetical protein BT63DRAFT_449489 [Microthyrium microscopicum]